MDLTLRLFKYVDGVNDEAFPSAADPAILNAFEYTAGRMGAAPQITGTLMHERCLDSEFTSKVYTEFKGERYFVRNTPSSSFSNEDARYKHDIIFVSERIILDSVYFFDIVRDNATLDRPRSNNSKVVFFGDINELVSRLNESMIYSGLRYRIVVDEGVSSEAKLVSIQDKFITEALQEIFNVFGLYYYFDGTTIHVGDEAFLVSTVFEYGAENSLISIEKNNNNNKLVNRCSGRGGTTNIPYYYPNESPYGSLNCLLNGSISDKINIVDWSRFARIGSAGTVTYKTFDPEETLVSQFDKTALKYVGDRYAFTLLGTQFYQTTFEMSVKVTTPRGRIVAGCYSENILLGGNNFCYVIQDGATIDLAATDGVVNYGEYTIRFEFTRTQNQTVEELYDLISAYVFVWSIGAAYDSWMLNNTEPVTLGYLGINYTGDHVPGDVISFSIAKERIPVVDTLMPSIYRDTNGAERFYNALNNTYPIPGEDGEEYVFDNPYFDGDPREHIEDFDDIYPTIEGTMNGNGQRIDEFLEFAYDLNDNDEFEEDGSTYQHPYFYAKLRKTNGTNGFNLFAQAIEGESMVLSVKSGNCGGCEWAIQVDDSTLKNTVHVYEEDTTDADGTFHAKGTLKRLSNGNVEIGPDAQDIQNDTENNEVWVALLKDQNTFGVNMPNAERNYKPSPGDKFVILGISLPQSYVLTAEQKLTDEVVKFMAENNNEKFGFSVRFSRIFLAEHPEVLSQLNENSSIKIKYDNNIIELYVSSYSYKMDASTPLPEVVVDLSDDVSINKGVLNTLVDEVGARVVYTINHLDISQILADTTVVQTNKPAAFQRQVSFGDKAVFADKLISKRFLTGQTTGLGWGLYEDNNGKSVLEIDKVFVRDELSVNTLEVHQTEAYKGHTIYSCGGCKIERIEEHPDFYRCYYDTKKNLDNSGFAAGDQAICKMFDGSNSNVIKYYWRLVVGADRDYVDLSKTDVDGEGIPAIGDSIVQFGNRTDVSRQNAIYIASTPQPTIIQYKGINSFQLAEQHEVTRISPDANKLSGRLTIEPGSSGANNLSDLPAVVGDAVSDELSNIEIGTYNMVRNSGFSGDYVTDALTPDFNLNANTDSFSDKLAHWEHSGAVVQESDYAESGYEVAIDNGYIAQNVYPRIIPGEAYVLSFYGQGTWVEVSIGGFSRRINLSTGGRERYVEKFIAQNGNPRITISTDLSSTVYSVQLERGTIASAWGHSALDNSSALAYYQTLEYLSGAIKNGNTTMLGGLILSNMMMLGNVGESADNTAGISGIRNGSEDVAFWGGGSYDKAINTVLKYVSNPNYQPSESELEDMANFVVTHSGDVFMKGYIYALGGLFSGTVKLAGEKILLKQDGSGHFANGRLSWDEQGWMTQMFPAKKVWAELLLVNNHIDLSSGGYIDNIVGDVDGTTIYMPVNPDANTSFTARTRLVSRSSGTVYIKANDGELFSAAITETDDLPMQTAPQVAIMPTPSGEIQYTFTYTGNGWTIDDISNASTKISNIGGVSTIVIEKVQDQTPIDIATIFERLDAVDASLKDHSDRLWDLEH